MKPEQIVHFINSYRNHTRAKKIPCSRCRVLSGNMEQKASQEDSTGRVTSLRIANAQLSVSGCTKRVKGAAQSLSVR